LANRQKPQTNQARTLAFEGINVNGTTDARAQIALSFGAPMWRGGMAAPSRDAHKTGRFFMTAC
jgi:hypothetical protein